MNEKNKFYIVLQKDLGDLFMRRFNKLLASILIFATMVSFNVSFLCSGSYTNGHFPKLSFGGMKVYAYTTGTNAQGNTTYTFNYTGNSESISIPQGKYKIECWGAQGSGTGGYVSGEFYPSTSTQLYIYVGGTNGYNGGGSGGNNGGGASDVRIVGGTDITSLRSRIIVAGGGGGGGVNYGNYNASTLGSGGNGGGLTGNAGTNTYAHENGVSTINTPSAGGSSQTAGGIGGTFDNVGVPGGFAGTSGSFGVGGSSGGGGGYYGGGGGGYSVGNNVAGYAFSSYGAGGGGSSFISGYTGCNAVDINGVHTGQPNHYSGITFSNTTMIAGANTGNGKVVITALNTPPNILITSPSANQVYSAQPGYNSFSFTGTVSDADSGDKNYIQNSVDGGANTYITIATGKTGTDIICDYILANGSSLPFTSTNINVSGYSEGTHILTPTAVDDKGGVSTGPSITIKMDKTDPVSNAPTVTADSTTQITVQAHSTDPTKNTVSAGLYTTPYLFNKDGLDGLWQSGGLVDTGLSVNTQHIYKYKARDAVGNENSTYSAAVVKYTLAKVPSGLLASSASNTSITMDWSANGNPAGTIYELYCNELTSTIFTGTALTYNHSGLSAGNTYTYKVRALNGDAIATAYTGTTSYRIASIPTGLIIDNIGTNTLRANWWTNGNTGGTQYQVNLIKVSDGSLVATDTVIGSACSFIGLDPNTQYKFNVSAQIMGNNYTNFAVSGDNYTFAVNPSSVTATSSTATEIIFVIVNDGSNGVVPENKIEVKLKNEGAAGVNVGLSDWNTATSRTVTGLAQDEEYEIWNSTRNGDGVANTAVNYITSIYSNRTPGISVTKTSSAVKSEIASFNQFTVTGNVYDADTGTVTVSALIGVVTKTQVINPVASQKGADNFSLSWTGSELPEGVYNNIPVLVTDSLNASSVSYYTGTLTIDKTGPLTPTLLPDIIVATTSAVTVTINNWGDAVTKQYRIDGGVWQNYNTPVVADQNCLIEAVGTDSVGNISTIGSLNIANIDSDPPTAPTIILSDVSWASSNVDVTVIDGVDTVSTIQNSEYKIGISGDWTNYSAFLTVREEGATVVYARTKDTSGFISTDASATIRIDKTNPTIRRVYIDNGSLYIVGEDNLGLNTSAYKFILQSTENLRNIQAIMTSGDPFQLALLLEADRDLNDQTTLSWVASNNLDQVRLTDYYTLKIRDRANNEYSIDVLVNKASGTLWGELSPEEIAAAATSHNSQVTELELSQKVLAEVVTIADDTPLNSGTGQISIDLSASGKYKIEVYEKFSGVLVYSKLIENIDKLVIPDLDDATAYIITVGVADSSGNIITGKSFEQTTPDRTVPVVASLNTTDGNFSVLATDNSLLSSKAYKFEIIAIDQTTTSKLNKSNYVSKLPMSPNVAFPLVLSKTSTQNGWELGVWTNKNTLRNVPTGTVIKTTVKDQAGNTTEETTRVTSNNEKYVDVVNANNPYIVVPGTSTNINALLNLDAYYEYTINDSSLALITGGRLNALKNGQVIITVKNKITGEVKQIVIKIKNVIKIAVRRVIVEKESTTNLRQIYKDYLSYVFGETNNLIWTSSNKDCADVNNDGQVYALKEGISKVSVSNEQGKLFNIYVIVAIPGSIKSNIQEINVKAPFLVKNGTKTNLNEITDLIDFKSSITKNGQFVVYESFLPGIACIEGCEMVAKSEGIAEIMGVDLINGVIAKIKVKVEDLKVVDKNFTDIVGHWVKNEITSSASKSILRGYSNNTFKPDAGISNAELTTVLSRTLLYKNNVNPMIDRTGVNATSVNSEAWYYNNAEDIVSKMDAVTAAEIFGNKFDANRIISRGEAAEIIMNITRSKLARKVTNYNYTDLEGNSHEAALRYCIETGILKGYGDGYIGGGNRLTRSETVVIINKLITNI